MKKTKFFITLLTGSLIWINHALPKNYVLFSPEDKPTKKLIEFIDTSKKSIYAAVYFLTDKNIAIALANAKKRGVDVQIVSDTISADSNYGKANLLAQSNIPVYIFNASSKKNKPFEQDQRFSYLPIMHHKFAIFDDTIVWTGSFNWTNAANDKNCENVIYTDDKETCQKYKTYWTSLTTQKCSKYTVAKRNIKNLAQQNRPRRRTIKALQKQWQTAQRVRSWSHVAKA